MNDIPKGRSVTVDMAHRFGMEPGNFEKVLRATVVPANCSPEQFAAFLLVAKQYNLNPITREIYAFPARGGGIQPIVGIDGWMRIINDHPQMDGLEFRDRFGDDKSGPDAITCLIHRKDREHPTVVTEYLSECKRDTEPWNKWPSRMLRHKAAIQAARYAFGFSGIIDPDEYERGVGASVSRETFTPPPPPSAPVLKGAPVIREQLEQSLKLTEEEKATIDDKIPAEGGGDVIEEPSPGEFVAVSRTSEFEAESGIDPDAYLDDLDSQMAVAKTLEDLEEIWKEHLVLADTLFPPDQDKADFIRERHFQRIRATLAVEASPKHKKK